MSKSPRPRPKPGRELSPPARKVLKSYFITDRRRLAKGDLVSVVSRAMDVGVDLVQVREKDLPGKELEELARHLVRRARRHPSVKILVNDRLDVALASDAAGVHLPAAGLPLAAVRRMAPPGFVIGVSTHSLAEARRASEEGADLVVFGPVFETTSKLGAPPVGLRALAEVVRTVRVPVFALGGITPERVKTVAAAGAAGVAGISVFLHEESLQRLMNALRL